VRLYRRYPRATPALKAYMVFVLERAAAQKLEPMSLDDGPFDMKAALGPQGKGLVWTAVQEGEPIADSKPYAASRVRASVIQVTNLGISVKDSPRNTLVFVTQLDTGKPVPGAKVSIVRLDNRVFWSGTTDQDGVAIAPNTPLREADNWWKFAFVVTAEKDGDVAYVGSDWNEGIQPWDFGVRST
jgi:uncharacterized protein YfaS (alpha-2-macroglobulin family)